MVKEIVTDVLFLSQKSKPATCDDLQIGQDLLDTLTANCQHCVGLAANMIGYLKNIIVVEHNENYIVLFNPVILKQTSAYSTTENCLSLEGSRPTKRYKSIKVQFQNEKFETRIKTFTGFTAQIIQHEIDHCNGIII